MFKEINMKNILFYFMSFSIIVLVLVGCTKVNDTLSSSKATEYFLNTNQINNLLTNKTIIGKFSKSSEYPEYFERTLLSDKSYRLVEYNKTSSESKNITKGTWYSISDKLCFMKPQILCEKIYYDGNMYTSIRHGKVWATFLIKDK